jgi:hypothetical protein
MGRQHGQNVIRPPAAVETRWAGSLPQIILCNEHITVCQMYRKNPAKNCVDNEDETAFENHLLEEYDWLLIADLDAMLCPIGRFISTLEATEKVTSSLVIPMVLAILNATNETTPVLRYSYIFGELSSEDIVPNENLCQEVIAVRKTLQGENKTRFVTEERERGIGKIISYALF